ncbi:toxin-antitoxin system, antitoxin component family protein [Actinomyces sp. Chiba101]|uniref:HepT-like ribonuclease domain-containing protein n=1 Tax=Actinomyces TaxID=1654 RepID=UPI000974E1DE|nr:MULTISPECIES: HepT-like ribonuclease domain-containing protein [Actinomyces]BAW92043.1 toxin-antitoxin system, antitoxin component family protein [Actinomyces sp. Chiba101]GAV95025.1 toxin-antitoxin system protein [Actinomyces denticolens]SUU11795.1 Protein of uncharacterised function DUF86 [Actinomyces denticolens]
MSRTQRECLLEALVHLDQIMRYAERDLADDAVRDAIALRLAAAIDSLARLPQDDLAGMFGDVWHDIKATRNRIVHGYLTVSAEIIDATVAEDLPELRVIIENALAAVDEIGEV